MGVQDKTRVATCADEQKVIHDHTSWTFAGYDLDPQHIVEVAVTCLKDAVIENKC